MAEKEEVVSFPDFSDKVTEKRLSRVLKQMGHDHATTELSTAAKLAYLEERLRVIEERLGITPPPMPTNDPLSALEEGVEDTEDSVE